MLRKRSLLLLIAIEGEICNRRVLRYNLSGDYIQRVDVELNADSLALLDPISVAVDNVQAYVADRGRSQIIRYQRRQP